MSKANQYIHIDLFSGIGGFSRGLQQANFPISQTHFSEIDKNAISVYRRNFPDAEYIGGIESVSGARFKNKKSIITFGFPCQDLSVAGKRRGFYGSRSSLFFEAMRIIREVRPDIFIFENVKGFYSSNDGKDFQIALQTIADIGLYECEWQLLNTAWFLPQNRERIYFVGHLAGRGGAKVFPIRDSGQSVQKKRYGQSSQAGCISTKNQSGQCQFDGGTTLIKTEISTAIDCNYHKGIDNHGQRTMVISNSALNRKFETRENLPPLRSHSGCGYDNYVKIDQKDIDLYKEYKRVDNICKPIRSSNPILSKGLERLIKKNQPVIIAQRGRYIKDGKRQGHKMKVAGLSTQRFEKREDGLTNTLTSVQKDNLVKINNTLFSKGFNGIIIKTNKGGCYAEKKERDTIKTLLLLRKQIGEKAFAEWGFRISDSFQQTEILRSSLYGEGFQPKAKKNKSSMDDCSLSCKEYKREGCLRKMWQSKKCRYSSCRWKLAKQFNKKLTKVMQELSQQSAQEKKTLYYLWEASKGLRILQQALYKIQKIWESTLHQIQEKGEHRVSQIRRLTPT